MLYPAGRGIRVQGGCFGVLGEIFSRDDGMKISPDLDAMVGGDMTRPRQLGGLPLPLTRGVDRADVHGGMAHYLTSRAAAPHGTGARRTRDREWAVAATRRETGIPLVL